MLFFVYNNTGQMIRVTDQSVDHNDPKKKVIGRWDMTSFEHALEIANAASRLMRRPLLACDRGTGVSPRYDVIFAPQIGDPVSRAFNGDCTPAGTITKISKSYRRVETDTGIKFYRRRETDGWYEGGGAYAMVHGHHYERAREI